MSHRRLYLDQVTGWAGPAIFRASAVQTGVRTARTITVAPLNLVVMRVTDSYEPDQVDAYQSADEALAAAERVMGLPDSRGVLREWVIQ